MTTQTQGRFPTPFHWVGDSLSPATGGRLQYSRRTKRVLGTPCPWPHTRITQMESREIDLIRELGRQRCMNRYYRTCYELYKELHQHVSEALDSLLRIYQDEPLSSLDVFSAVYDVTDQLQTVVEELKAREDQAAREQNELSPNF